MRVSHFDRVIAEIDRVLARSKDLEPQDRQAIREAAKLFARLQQEYHGETPDDGEEAV